MPTDIGWHGELPLSRDKALQTASALLYEHHEVVVLDTMPDDTAADAIEAGDLLRVVGLTVTHYSNGKTGRQLEVIVVG